MKILMVCLGNICRSPLAEGILRAKMPTHFSVDSAGTAAYHVGNPPDPRSIEVAHHNQIDISQQRAKKFEVKDFDTFDLIFAMDQENYENIIRLARNSSDKAKVDMILNQSYPGKNLSVPDPYYGGDEGFRKVYQMLDDATTALLQNLEK